MVRALFRQNLTGQAIPMTDFILRNSSPADLTEYVARQLATFFPDGHSASAKALYLHMRIALERLRSCFAGIQKPKFRDGPHILFNYMHPDHYAVLLYLLANTIVQHDRDDPLAFRVYYLNKALHGLDVYPAVGGGGVPVHASARDGSRSRRIWKLFLRVRGMFGR